LGLQKDGASCGFWVATVALLIVFEIDPSSTANKNILDRLGGIGAKGLKALWKAIMVSYLQDPIGLQAIVLQDFLSKFQDWKGFPNGIECVGLFNLF
jgi:hypothetical protein